MSSSRDMPDYGPGRKNQYFVPGEGIAREVITADICKYLDNDATVRPFNYQGREGYMLFAYRNLTSAMVEDLKRDTTTWEREQRERRHNRPSHRNMGGSSGGSSSRSSATAVPARDHNASLEAYVDSQTHHRRQMHGPTVPDTPSPGLNDGYAPGRGPPPINYHQQEPSPHHQQYGGMPPPAAAFGAPSRAPAFAQTGYAPERDLQSRSMNTHDMSGYPQDSAYGAPAPAGSFSSVPGRAYAQGQHPGSATVGPGASRESREPRYDYTDPRNTDPRANDPRAAPRLSARPDVRADPRHDPRADPRGDGRAASRMDPPRQYQPDHMDQDPPRFSADTRADPRYAERGYPDPRYRR